MKVEGSRFARPNAGAALAVLMAGLLASCTATSGPGFDMAAPSYNGVGVADVMADVAQSESDVTVSTSGDAAATIPTGGDAAATASTAPADVASEEALPQQVALLPFTKPAAETTPESAAEPAANPAEPAPAESGREAAATDEPATEAGDDTTIQAAVETEPKKRGFLASFFSPAPAVKPSPAQSAFAPAQTAAAPAVAPEPEEKEEAATPLIDLSSKTRPVQHASFGGDALPGVRQSSLFEIKHKSGIDDDSDVDLHEDEGAPMLMASAAGLARLAPNGLLKQRESVDVACLKPALVRVLKTVERHYGKRMIVTSGYRSPGYNKRVRGAKRSQHMYCAAADVQVPGVSKWELAKLVRSMPGRGGVGTYCHTESVHIDVGPERDWNWRCRRRKS